MLELKALHIIAMVAWFAGLFYLPRLFIYHVDSQDEISISRFWVMERRLYYGIMWPAAIMTTLFGTGLILYNPQYYFHARWMHAKLAFVIVLWIYHLSCGYYRKLLQRMPHSKSSIFFRIYNEVPTVLLILIVLLVVIKP